LRAEKPAVANDGGLFLCDVGASSKSNYYGFTFQTATHHPRRPGERQANAHLR
jgi:hypothetical protein